MKRTMNHILTMAGLWVIVTGLFIYYSWPIMADVVRGNPYRQVISDNQANINFLLTMLLFMAVGLLIGYFVKYYIRKKHNKLSDID